VFTAWLPGVLAFLLGAVIVFIYFLNSFGLRESKLFRINAEKRGRSWSALAMEHLPVGVLLINNRERILWANNYLAHLVGKNILAGLELGQVFPGYSLKDVQGQENGEIYHWSKRVFYLKAVLIPGECQDLHVLTCEDITNSALAYRRGQDTQPIIAFIQVDNLGEVLKNMAEEDKPHLQGALEKTLTDWVYNLEGYLKQTGEAKYLLFLNQWGIRQAEKSRSAILDRIKEVEVGNSMPLTISMGIGLQEESLSEMGSFACTALG